VSSPAPITEAEVQQLATRWYAMLDAHVPVEEYTDLLAADGLEMRYPEATLRNFADFTAWYERVTRLFFDEVHTLKEVAVPQPAAEPEATVVVNWQASFWKPPAAKSERIVLDSYHTWVLTRSPTTNKPVILKYYVEHLDYHEGSARL
jgi:hypothetical protein